MLLQVGNRMKTNKILGYIILSFTVFFIIIYLIDGITEIANPYKGLGFAYKSFFFYFLKLFYSVVMLVGGIFLINSKKSWYNYLLFSAIGILISSCLFYVEGYLFRSSIFDIFLLEILSFALIIILNIKSFVKKVDIEIPRNNWFVFLIFVIINIALNYLSLYFSKIYFLN